MATCIECKATFRARRYDADFCCTAHRNAFNNRRRDRGAMLYDLAMIEATNPKVATEHDFPSRRESLVTEWLGEDQAVGLTRSHKRLVDVLVARR